MLPFIHWLYDNTFLVDQEIKELEYIPKCITWNVNEKINSYENIYVQILCEEDCLTDYFKPSNLNLFNVNLNIFKKTGILFNRRSFFRSINESLIIDYYKEFNDYAASNLSSFDLSKNYNNIIDIFKVISDIEKYPLKLRGSLLKYNPYLNFSPFTKTGRLRTIKDFFPIYNLEKKLRVDIIPSNDYIMEVDYNAAEFRIFLALCGQEQPKDDAYLEIQSMFHLDSRNEAKNKVFEIIYSNYYKNDKISSIINKYVDGNKLTTPYGFEIYLDDPNKLINYLCQSTCSFLIYEKTQECIDLLKSFNSKSRVMFCFHDAIVFDLHKDDIGKISKLKEIISNTRFGSFKNRVKVGTNYCGLQEINL